MNKKTKKNGFTPVLILIVIAILGVVGYFIGKENGWFINKDSNTQDEIVQNGLKIYKNDTYGIEFQYDQNSVISYERKDGKIYQSGKLVGPEFVQKAVDDKGVILTLNDTSLIVNINGREGADDVQYFTLEFEPKNEPWTYYQACSDKDKTKLLVNKNNISYLAGELQAMGGVNRFACIEHGDLMWVLSGGTFHKENSDKTIRLFNNIVDSFKFTK